jgi:hypothetical protein
MVMTLPGFVESVISWVQEKELQNDLNEQFRQKHPWLHPSLTLAKIRKTKRQFLDVTAKLVCSNRTCCFADMSLMMSLQLHVMWSSGS